MKPILTIMAIALGLALPVNAYAQAMLVHAESGLILPDHFEGMSHKASKDSSNPLNSIYAYTGEGNTATVYVFRATHPNAALWFERAQAILQLVWADRGLGAGTTQRLITLAGAKSPNGFAREFAVSGQSQSTAVAVAEVNGWIVKVRLTSDKNGVDATAKQLDRLLLTFAAKTPPAAPHPLILPDACPLSKATTSINALAGSEVIAKPKAETILLLGLQLAVLSRQIAGDHGSLASNPELYCRTPVEGQGPIAMAYKPKDPADNSWTILFADSGTSISGTSAMIMEGKNDIGAGGMLTANTLEKVNAIVVAKGIPAMDVGFPTGASFIVKGGAVLSAVAYGTANVEISLPDKK